MFKSTRCKNCAEPQTRNLPFTYLTDYNNGEKIDIFTNNEVGAIKIKKKNKIAVETEADILEIKIPTPEYVAAMMIYAFTPKRFRKVLPFVRYVNKDEVEEIVNKAIEKTLHSLEKAHVYKPEKFVSSEEYGKYFVNKLNYLKYSLPNRFKRENRKEVKIIKDILENVIETVTQITDLNLIAFKT